MLAHSPLMGKERRCRQSILESQSVSRSVLSDSVTPRTVAGQACLSMGFSRQESWSGLRRPPPADLLDQGLNLGLLHCRQILHHLSPQDSRQPRREIHSSIH